MKSKIDKNQLLLILFALIVFVNNNLSACSCTNTASVSTNLKISDVVVLGTVIKVEKLKLVKKEWKKVSLKEERNNGEIIVSRVLVKIHSAYKGTISKKIIINTEAVGKGGCGFRFVKGEKYLVYGHNKKAIGRQSNPYLGSAMSDKENIFWTDICTNTKVADAAEAKTLARLTEVGN